MILTKRQLKYFENFEVNNMIAEGYSNERFDEIVVVYVKDERTFFGGTKELEWKKKYKFKRSQSPSEEEGYNVYTTNPEYTELYKQLEDIVKDDWQHVTKETYDWLRKEHPERVV